ncbi:hypothetical protein LCGC14_2493820, partial [marine sediment metagenome]
MNFVDAANVVWYSRDMVDDGRYPGVPTELNELDAQLDRRLESCNATFGDLIDAFPDPYLAY